MSRVRIGTPLTVHGVDTVEFATSVSGGGAAGGAALLLLL